MSLLMPVWDVKLFCWLRRFNIQNGKLRLVIVLSMLPGKAGPGAVIRFKKNSWHTRDKQKYVAHVRNGKGIHGHAWHPAFGIIFHQAPFQGQRHPWRYGGCATLFNYNFADRVCIFSKQGFHALLLTMHDYIMGMLEPFECQRREHQSRQGWSHNWTVLGKQYFFGGPFTVQNKSDHVLSHRKRFAVLEKNIRKGRAGRLRMCSQFPLPRGRKHRFNLLLGGAKIWKKCWSMLWMFRFQLCPFVHVHTQNGNLEQVANNITRTKGKQPF